MNGTDAAAETWNESIKKIHHSSCSFKISLTNSESYSELGILFMNK